jgi:hypothetical protein
LRPRPGIRRLDAGQHLEERRLAGAVGTHEADPVAFRQAERQPFEEGVDTVGLADALAAQEGEPAHLSLRALRTPLRTSASLAARGKRLIRYSSLRARLQERTRRDQASVTGRRTRV